MSDLDEILSGGEGDMPAEPEVIAEPEQPDAPVAEVETPEQEPVAEPAPVVPADHMVPVSVVQELRAKLRSLEQSSSPPPEAPKAPDMFENPEGYQAYVAHQMAVSQSNIRAEMSEMMARQAHGDDTVNAAFEAAQAAGVVDQFRGQQNPWGSLVKWHQSHQVMQEIGNDPAAYRAKVEAEVRQKIQAEMATQQAQKMAAQPAPSMANLNGTGGGVKTTWTGPPALTEILPE